MHYNWDWSILNNYWEAILSGIATSLCLSLISILIGTALGIIILYCQVFTRSKLIKTFIKWIVELLLSIPLLVLLVWIYYCIPILTTIKISAFLSCIIAFSINLSPFISETLRSGLDSLPKGYTEAGLALNLPKKTIIKKILLPQVFIEMLPALITQYISLFKLSSLASVIAVNEILHTANNIISETYRPLEVFTIIAIVYIVIIVPISKLTKLLENRDGLSK